jgi:diguanylate cyclase (GGDEF)-like protein
MASWFVHLPYFLLLAAAIAVILYFTDQSFFAAHDPARGAATLLLGCLFLPPLTAIFHRSQERGLLTSHGAMRAVAILVLAGFIITLPLISGFQQSVITSAPPSFHTDSGWLRIPGVGLLALLGSLPFLLFRHRGESPCLGPLLGMAVLSVFLALNFSSSLCHPSHQRAALILFGSLGGFILLLTVLETAWRHMNIDELTELPGRRPLKHRLRCLGSDYIIALVDIDHFKRINDTYGHPAGDQILRYVAAELRLNPRGTAYRYGGEEFVVVFERIPYKAALDNLDDLRHAISQKDFFLRGEARPARKPSKTQPRQQDTPVLHLTISIGAATPSAHYRTPQEVLEAADQALYKAKENGRNRVCHIA